MINYFKLRCLKLTSYGGEQPLPAKLSCNLSSINLSNYVLNPFTKNAKFDLKEFYNNIPYIVEAMDNIIDENAYNHPLKEQTEQVLKYRNLGIGVMGLADCFIKLGIIYGSSESIAFINDIFTILFKESVKSSANLSEKLGSFPGYTTDVYKSKIIHNHFTNEEIQELTRKGLRNCSLLSIAPTGSIALLFNGISGGVEPHFRLSYIRNTKSLHKDGEKSYEIHVNTVREAKECDVDTTLPYFIESQQINWKDRINVQSAMQSHIDTAISSTINLSKETTVEEIEQLYLYAWKMDLKGTTIFRDSCRSGILTTNESDVKQISSDILKRPESIPAKVVRFKNGSDNWLAFIGMINEKPYEIFTGKTDIESFPVPTNIKDGKIIKVRDNIGKRYDFEYIDKYGYVNRLGGLSRIFNQEYWNYAKLISALLRGGIELDKIVKIIDGMHFESDTLNTWKNGVKRAIKMFISDGVESYEKCPDCGEKLIYEGGCSGCKNCGFSRCS